LVWFYADAVNWVLDRILEEVPESVLIGQGVTSPWYVGSTTRGLIDKYGPSRVIDTPVSENAVTGAAAGMALAGMRPIVVHPRMDFMLLAMDAIVNQIANWRFMFGGEAGGVPLVIWSIVNRGGEQGAQHSQALHAMLAHVPGLKVVAPSSPRSAIGLFWSAVNDPDPVVLVDDRWLYWSFMLEEPELFTLPVGAAEVVRRGEDVTVVASSFASLLARFAAHLLPVDVEVVDLLSLKPWDWDSVKRSVSKTGRLLVVDGGWRTCGFAAEVVASVAEYDSDIEVRRLTLPDKPAPAASSLERQYFLSVESLRNAVLSFDWEGVRDG